MIQTSKKTEKEVANDKSAKIMNGVATWCSFYRANPHRFAKDYLGISLKLFQVILLYMMNVSNYFMYLAARGQGLDKEFDKPYSEEGKRYRAKLLKMANKYKHLVDFYYIFDEQNLLQKKDAPVDKGQEVFEKLYKKKIKVR